MFIGWNSHYYGESRGNFPFLFRVFKVITLFSLALVYLTHISLKFFYPTFFYLDFLFFTLFYLGYLVTLFIRSKLLVPYYLWQAICIWPKIYSPAIVLTLKADDSTLFNKKHLLPGGGCLNWRERYGMSKARVSYVESDNFLSQQSKKYLPY